MYVAPSTGDVAGDFFMVDELELRSDGCVRL